MYLERVIAHQRGGVAWASVPRLVRAAALIALLYAADRIIVRQPFLGRPFWAACDVLVHGAVALAVAGPCIQRADSMRRALALAGLACFSATALDLDHFAAAGSLAVRAALVLSARPPTHSLTFALLLGAVLYRFSRDRAAAWVAFAAVASHVLRDAAMGTAPLLWPLPFDHVPWWTYVCGELGLAWASRGWTFKVPGRCVSFEPILPTPDDAVLE